MADVPNYPSITGVSFKFSKTSPSVVVRNDGTSIFIGSDTPDGRQYTAWLAAGNVTAPADPPNAEENAYTQEVIDKDTLATLVNTLLPPTYTLTDLASDITSLKAYYQADAAPTLANLKTNLRTSLRVEAFMLRWIARNRPR